MPKDVLQKRYSEYDNNIHDFRIALGYTVQKLSEIINIHPVMLTNIACGYHGPFKIDGTEKVWVSKLCKVFEKTIPEIWPFEMCKIKVKPDNPEDYVYAQIQPEFCGQYSRGTSVCKKIDVERYLNYLPERSRNIFIKYHVFGYTIDEIAKDYNLSRARIQQINVWSMYIIRKKIYKEAESQLPGI